jgi:DNA-binding transcriptional regulator GbsR (MarR family)
MANKSEDVVVEFVEQMGLILQAEGLPRIAGRIMGLMVMHGGPFSLTELANCLSVSRASISTNTRLLEDLGVIERTATPGDRQDYFRLSRQPYARMLRGIVRRMGRAREVVGSTQEALPADMPEAHERLEELDAFYEAIIETFENVVDGWDAKGQGSTRQKRVPARPSA